MFIIMCIPFFFFLGYFIYHYLQGDMEIPRDVLNFLQAMVMSVMTLWLIISCIWVADQLTKQFNLKEEKTNEQQYQNTNNT